MKKITAIIAGAGSRGKIYSDYAKKYPNELQITAVAEPNEVRRNSLGEAFDIPMEKRYASWEIMLEEPQMADALVVCMMDRLHYEPSEKGLKKGYHVLVEKPMSPYPEESVKMSRLSDKYPGQVFMVGHVLRYTPFFRKIKDLLLEKRIGKVIGIQLNENIEYWHIAHSYVRGNWRNSDQSSSIILSKCCHDLDILTWLTESECEKISSFGSLQYFKESNAPEGAGLRCANCMAEEKCPYSVKKIYLREGAILNPVLAHILSSDTDDTEINANELLYNSPFGRCVFHCDNNVADHQVVNIVFKNGIIANFLMGALTAMGQGRTIKIMGSHGEISGIMGESRIVVDDFVTLNKETITLTQGIEGHGGGDEGIMKGFLDQIRSDNTDPLTSAKKSVESHLMCFAAEESRSNDKVVIMDEYKNRFAE